MILIAVIPASADSEDVIGKAQTLFAKGQYSDGQNLLKNNLRDQSLNSLQRSQILYSLGNFSYECVGDFDTAMTFYRRITDSDLGDDQDIKIQAQEKNAEIEALKTEFLAQDKLLKEISTQSYHQLQSPQIEKLISQLKSLALQNPDYYKIAHVHFFMGLNQEKLKNYKAAYTSFEKAMEYKPAMDFYLPLSRMETVLEKWRRQRINSAVWGVAGILLVIIALTYYLSTPWRWMRLRHVMVGLSMIVLWWGVFKISHTWLGSRYVVPETIKADLLSTPKYPSAAPGSYGSEVAEYLFGYGLVGVVSLYTFALGSSRLKFRLLVFCANGVMGLLIVSAMVTIFYMRHCDRKSDFISQGQGITFYAAGEMYFQVHEPEASVLTNPKAYPNPLVGNADAEFKEWLLRHCEFDKPREQESTNH